MPRMTPFFISPLLAMVLFSYKGATESDDVKVFGMQTDPWAMPTTDVVIRYNLSQRIPQNDPGEYSTISLCYWAKPTTLTGYETHISLAISDQKNDVLHLYRRGEQHGFYYNGVRQFGFILNITTPVGLNEWTHYCHIFNHGKYTNYINGNQEAHGKVDSKIIPLPLRGIITFGQEQDLLAGGYAVDQCFRGYMAQFNIWNRAITKNEITQLSDCKQLILGNIFSSDREELEIFGATTQNTNMKQLCEHHDDYVIFPEAEYMKESKLKCKRVGYHVYSPSNPQENSILHNKSLPFAKECGSNYHLWIGVTDKVKEGEWRKFKDNTVVQDTPFELFEPNGNDGENCVLMFLPNGLWVDTSCEIKWPACVPCEVAREKPLRLRGFCFSNEAETFYEVLGYKGGKPLIYGYYGVMIFRTSEGHWEMFDTTLNETVATMVAPSEDFYPIGRREWTLKKSMCKYNNGATIELSLTVCRNNEFSCSNGDCISKEKRCNGNNDCPDFSDEDNCTILNIPKGYRSKRQPDNGTEGEALYLIAAVHILRFMEISNLQQTLNLELTMEIMWRDSRLSFLDLDDISDVNKLADEEMSAIWKPKVKFPNVYNGRTDLLEEEIKVTKSAPPMAPDYNDVRMDTVFSGSSVSLMLRQRHSARFICHFDVYYYPFDVQQCKILFQLESVRKDLVTFSEDLAEVLYNGSEELPEYILSKYGIFVTEFVNNNLTFSVLEVEVTLKRRWTVIVLNVFLPTSLLQCIGYSTLFIDFATLDVRLAVSLTTLLVLYTLFNNTSDSLPITAYVKMIDIWFFYCIFLLFITTLAHVIVECIRQRNAIVKVTPTFKGSKTTSSPKLIFSRKYDLLIIIRIILIPALALLFNLLYWSLLIADRNSNV